MGCDDGYLDYWNGEEKATSKQTPVEIFYMNLRMYCIICMYDICTYLYVLYIQYRYTLYVQYSTCTSGISI